MDCFDNCFQFRNAQDGWRASAEIYCVELAEPAGLDLHLPTDGPGESRDQFMAGDGIKRAIGAFTPAKRDMNIKAGKGHHILSKILGYIRDEIFLFDGNNLVLGGSAAARVFVINLSGNG